MRHNDIENCGLLVEIRFRRHLNKAQGPSEKISGAIREGTREGTSQNAESFSEQGIETPRASPLAAKCFNGFVAREDSDEPAILEERGALDQDAVDLPVKTPRRELKIGCKLSL